MFATSAQSIAVGNHTRQPQQCQICTQNAYVRTIERFAVCRIKFLTSLAPTAYSRQMFGHFCLLSLTYTHKIHSTPGVTYTYARCLLLLWYHVRTLHPMCPAFAPPLVRNRGHSMFFPWKSPQQRRYEEFISFYRRFFFPILILLLILHPHCRTAKKR